MNFSNYLTFVNAELVGERARSACSLNCFFNLKTRLDRYRLIRIVLGNESADLDSAVASSVYAYFLHRVGRKKKRFSSIRNSIFISLRFVQKRTKFFTFPF